MLKSFYVFLVAKVFCQVCPYRKDSKRREPRFMPNLAAQGMVAVCLQLKMANKNINPDPAKRCGFCGPRYGRFCHKNRTSFAGPVMLALCLKNMKLLLVISLILQVALVALFLLYVHQADLAMGKDGIGDVERFNTFNKYAGFSFYSAVAFWVFAFVSSLMTKQFKSKEAQLAIAASPIAVIVGWVSLWFI